VKLFVPLIDDDQQLWYAGFKRGHIGILDPASGQVTEYAMAVARNDCIWIVETGRMPNRLAGFDASAGSFLTESDIPSGAGSVSHLFYHEAGGEIWFGAETNYIGRAIVH
jgi:virginiamycin B lyase